MDVFSTNYLLGVVQDLKRPPMWALQKFFTRTTQDTSEEIHFDVIDRTRRLAPFVSPLVEGKVMNQAGRTVKTFSPAYTKDKRIFEPGRAFKRAVGERIGGGELTPQQRIELAIVEELQDQINILDRRQEVMAVEALRTGKVTVVGDGYPSVVVDFGRDAALNPAALAGTGVGTAPWTHANARPLKNLRDWALVAFQKSGVWPSEVAMSVEAFDAFVDHDTVSKRWAAANPNVTGTLTLGAAVTAEGGVYMGSIDGLNIYVYAGWYIDADGNEQPMLPAGELFMAGAGVEGVRAYGAIKDHDALAAVPYFPKSWKQDDPSVRFLMLQSAPLMVPTRPNATYARKVA